MFGGKEVPDKELSKTVNQRLARAGSQSSVTATVQRGTVTLTGKLRYEMQRAPLLKAARSVAGVRQVVDQLQAPPRTKPQAK